MSEKQIVAKLKEYVGKQNNGWRFMYGRSPLTKEQVITRIENDKSFRGHLVKLVVSQTIEMLGR